MAGEAVTVEFGVCVDQVAGHDHLLRQKERQQHQNDEIGRDDQ
jgi:hypothetical protein